MKKEKRNCYINWSQLYNFVIKDYGLTEIGVITKYFGRVLDSFNMFKIYLKFLK